MESRDSRDERVGQEQARTTGAPGALRGMPSGVRAKITAEIERAYRGVPSAGRRAQATRHAVVERTARLYADLWALGYTGLKLDNLRLGHLEALLDLWRNGRRDAQGSCLRRPISRAGASNLWTVVRGWVDVIGKHGMAREFVAVWPVEAPATQSPRGDGLRRRQAIADLDENTYQAILGSWLQSSSKLTHYWLLRAVKELGLDTREALALNPYTASVLEPGTLVIKKFAQRNSRKILLDTEAKRELVRGLGEFTDAMRRHRLGWPLKEVGSDDAADRRLRKALYYARDRLIRTEGPEVGVGRGGRQLVEGGST